MNNQRPSFTNEKQSVDAGTVCTRCTKLLPGRLFAKGRSRRQKRLVISARSQSKTTSSCPFCVFLGQISKLEAEFTEHQDTSVAIGLSQPVFSTFYTQKPWWDVLGLETNRPLPTFAWYEPFRASGVHRPVNPKVVVTWIPAKDKHDPDAWAGVPRRRSTNETEEGMLDLSIAKEWLELCEKEHLTACQFDKQIKTPMDIRLIDLHTRDIVAADTDVRYVALSYVWGSTAKSRHGEIAGTQVSVSLTKKLPKILPTTLEDAIAISIELGEHYLWIDFFCIDQTNEHEVESQIQQMNIIYQSATFTIVARDGENAYAGIAGISRPMKLRSQPICHLPDGELMATALRPAIANAGKAIWDTRAWTMQEWLFSFRVLSFTDHNLRMICRQEYFVDTIVTETGPDRNPVTFISKDDWDDVLALDLRVSAWDFRTFNSLISLYTARLLKFPDDILNACRGALTELEMRTNVHFKHGLPVEDIHRALLWSPHSSHTLSRRSGFPSWSWSGWFGRIDYRQWIVDLTNSEHWQLNSDLTIINKKSKRRKDNKISSSVSSKKRDVAKISFLREGVLRIRSETATCALQKRRDDRKSSTLLTVSDDQVGTLVKKNICYHWTILNSMRRPIIDIANNAEEPDVFDETNHFLRLSQEQSEALEAVDGQVQLVIVHDLPLVRDSYEHDWYLADMVSCLVLVEDGDGKLWRLGGLLLEKNVFEAFKPEEREVDIL